jgi:hypothetical protein
MRANSFYTVPFVWNKTLWVTTFAVFGLWLGVSGFQLYEIFTQKETLEPLIALIVLNAIMLPTIIICEGLAPQRLEICKDKIVILRRYKSVTINRSEIKSVQLLSKSDFRNVLRLSGVGGLFGYFGRYYSSKLGTFQLFATSFQNLYLIRKCDGKNVVISCAEPDKMEIFL